MSQHPAALGLALPARATLARLRQTLQQPPRWANDADAQAFLREAAALIEGNQQGRRSGLKVLNDRIGISEAACPAFVGQLC